MEYKPNCGKCHVYPATHLSGDRGLCLRCYHEVVYTSDEKERQQAQKELDAAVQEAKAQKEAETLPKRGQKAQIPHCGACLTTLHIIKDGLCLRCSSKHRRPTNQLLNSYVSHTPTMNSDPNKIY